MRVYGEVITFEGGLIGVDTDLGNAGDLPHFGTETGLTMRRSFC